MADNGVIVVADDIAIITAVNGSLDLEVQIEATQVIEVTDSNPWGAWISPEQVDAKISTALSKSIGSALVFGG